MHSKVTDCQRSILPQPKGLVQHEQLHPRPAAAFRTRLQQEYWVRGAVRILLTELALAPIRSADLTRCSTNFHRMVYLLEIKFLEARRSPQSMTSDRWRNNNSNEKHKFPKGRSAQAEQDQVRHSTPLPQHSGLILAPRWIRVLKPKTEKDSSAASTKS